MNPCIADLLSHHRQRSAHGFQLAREVIQRRGSHLRAGELGAQMREDAGHLGLVLRPQVVDGVTEGQRGAPAGQREGAAVTALVHHHHLRAGGILPAEERRHFGYRRARVDADVQELHACLGQQRHDAARVPGHVGELGRQGLHAKAPVEPLREQQPGAEQVGVHQLAVRGERQRVPGDFAAPDGFLHRAPPVGVGLLKIFVDQPRAGRPDEAVRAVLLAHAPRQRQRGRDVTGEILLRHIGGVIGKADVQVRFEDQVNFERHGRSLGS